MNHAKPSSKALKPQLRSAATHPFVASFTSPRDTFEYFTDSLTTFFSSSVDSSREFRVGYGCFSCNDNISTVSGSPQSNGLADPTTSSSDEERTTCQFAVSVRARGKETNIRCSTSEQSAVFNLVVHRLPCHLQSRTVLKIGLQSFQMEHAFSIGKLAPPSSSACANINYYSA